MQVGFTIPLFVPRIRGEKTWGKYRGKKRGKFISGYVISGDATFPVTIPTQILIKLSPYTTYIGKNHSYRLLLARLYMKYIVNFDAFRILLTKGETIHHMYRNHDYFGDGSVHDTWRPLTIPTI